jgi:phage terminase large subunit
MSQEISVKEIIAPGFQPVFWKIMEHCYTHYWLGGGRGSTKSSFIGIVIILLIITNPRVHALVMRKIGNTLRDSVFAQMIWAIDVLGLTDKFKVKVAPMEITYKATGQKVLFRGADDKTKIKSIKIPFGYIGIGWYEELDQFSEMDEIRSINQSVMRGGEKFWMFYSFNPPKSRDNWVNIEKIQERPDRLYHHSTYLDVPAEWIGQQFIYEAEILKQQKPDLYEHEYLGIATGTGGSVFENLQEREITEEEISGFDRLYYGVDYGFAVDPFAWCKLHFDAKRRILYVLDEIYELKLSNRKATELMKQKHTGHIFADSADSKSIAEMKSLGLWIDPAKKGPDSVEYGIKWLQDLETIVIDKRRTPNAYREFSLYEYEQNRDGEFISAYPDKNNHYIDACRYALSNVMKQNAGWGFSKNKLV